MRVHTSRGRLVVLAVLAMACGVTACDSSDTADHGAAEEEIRVAFERVQSAFFDGDGRTVCDGLAARARAEVASGGRDCAAAFSHASARDRTGKPGDPVAEVRKVRVDGDRAVVTVAIGGERSTVPFVTEDGEWKVSGGFGVDR